MCLCRVDLASWTLPTPANHTFIDFSYVQYAVHLRISSQKTIAAPEKARPCSFPLSTLVSSLYSSEYQRHRTDAAPEKAWLCSSQFFGSSTLFRLIPLKINDTRQAQLPRRHGPALAYCSALLPSLPTSLFFHPFTRVLDWSAPPAAPEKAQVSILTRHPPTSFINEAKPRLYAAPEKAWHCQPTHLRLLSPLRFSYVLSAGLNRQSLLTFAWGEPTDCPAPSRGGGCQ